MPHLVNGLLEDGGALTELVCSVTKLGMMMYTRRRPRHFTDRDLVAIDQQIAVMDKLLRKLFPDMNFDTPKYHNLSHFTEDVRRHGHPEGYNADIFETDHVWIKRIYR
jgi:hypothetical protein